MNDNGALAKSRYPRTIPVTEDVVGAYTDYQFERDRYGSTVGGGLASPTQADSVFVNLFRPPRSRAMRYATVNPRLTRIVRATSRWEVIVGR